MRNTLAGSVPAGYRLLGVFAWTHREVTVNASRSVLESLFAAGDAGDLDRFDSYMHEDVAIHAPAGLSTRGVDSEKESWRKARAAPWSAGVST